MVRPLPQELIDHIVDNLSDDTDKLRELVNISTIFWYAARRHLYRCMHVLDMYQDGFQTFLTQWRNNFDYLSRCVRKLIWNLKPSIIPPSASAR